MPKSEKELRARDAKRDLGQELLQSVREMKARRRGRTHKAVVRTARETGREIASPAEAREILALR